MPYKDLKQLVPPHYAQKAKHSYPSCKASIALRTKVFFATTSLVAVSGFVFITCFSQKPYSLIGEMTKL
ncbi:hypothetical protein LIER_33993 [Lithospermum erythrorhizon]|uniref:Transmembrane protein n=1 Tax=Lithospermum erythrorhizon TaxID=34254 RepID=A0AAV3S1E0_LITER